MGVKGRKSSDFLSKDNVLKKVDEVAIFAHFCRPFKAVGQAFNSELRKDENPSAVIFKSKSGGYMYKDFSNGEVLNVFDYVCKKYNVNYIEALSIIDSEMGLELASQKRGGTIRHYQQIAKNLHTEERRVLIQIHSVEWAWRFLRYWKQYNVNKYILNKFKVVPITAYWINGIYYPCGTYPTYAYCEYAPYYKLYSPTHPDRIRKWKSNTKSFHIQGWHMLPTTGDLVIIAASLKDVMVLASLGYYAIAPTHESPKLDPKMIQNLQQRFPYIYLLYDNDHEKSTNWGQEKASKVLEQYPDIRNLVLPFLEGVDDIAELVRIHGPEKAKTWLKQALNEWKKK